MDSMTNEDENAKVVIEKSSDREKHFQQDVKNGISEIYEQLFFHDESNIDVLEKSNRYRFSLDNCKSNPLHSSASGTSSSHLPDLHDCIA